MAQGYAVKRLLQIMFALAGVLCGVVAAEIVLRIIPGFGLSSVANNGWNVQQGRYRTSSVYGYELVPGSAGDVNSFGMRDREYSLKKPRGVYRILVLGDSITEWGKWSDYLESALNEEGNYEVLNCAVAGWNLFQYHEYIKHKALQYEPDMILIGFCLNDIPDAFDVKSLYAGSKDTMTTSFNVKMNSPGASLYATLHVNPYFFQRSALYRLYVMRYVAGKAGQLDGNNDPLTALKLLEDMKKMFHGPVCGVVFPFIKPLDEYDRHGTKELDIRAEKGFYTETMDVLGKAGLPILDLTPVFNGYGKDIYRFRHDTHDQVHFNDDGNRIIAFQVHAWLNRSFLKKNIK